MTKLLVTPLVLWVACFSGTLRAQEPDVLTGPLGRAEEAFTRGEYEEASALFEGLVGGDWTPEQERWIAFRLPDARWRWMAGALNPAGGEEGIAVAGAQLESFLQDSRASGLGDRAWAEASESYADWLWQRRVSARFEAALAHYRHALDHWAGLGGEASLERVFGILDKLVRPAWAPAAWRYGQRGEYVPLELSEQAWRLARTPDQRAKAALLLAMNLATEEQGPAASTRLDQLFRLAHDSPSPAAVQRDALLFHGQWLERAGPWVRAADGLSRRQSDPAAAQALYEALLERFPDSRSNPWIGIARERIATLARQELEVRVEHDFLPGSQPGFYLRWRNVERIEFSLHALNFDQTPTMKGVEVMPWHWLEAIEAPRTDALHSWSYETRDDGRHRLEERELSLEPELVPGAYLLEARAGDQVRRALVNVSAITLVAKAAGRRVLTWVTRAEDGQPLEGARVRVQSRVRNEAGVWSWNETTALTDRVGLAWTELPESSVNAGLFVSATHAGQVALTASGSTFSEPPMLWRFFASTDRPTHRPGQRLAWSLMARRQRDLETETPASSALDFQLRDSSGEVIESGHLELDSFGCANGAVELPQGTAEGALRLELQDPAAKRTVGLTPVGFVEPPPRQGPRVKIDLGVDPLVSAGPQSGRPVLSPPVMGEMVEIVLQAVSADGQPEARAELDVVVQAHGWHARFPRMSEWQWFARAFALGKGIESQEELEERQRQEVARKQLVTDASGLARLYVSTADAKGRGHELEVEVQGHTVSGTALTGFRRLRLLPQSFTARAWAGRTLFEPGESVEIGVEARDARGAAVVTGGQIQLLSLPPSGHAGEWVEVQVAELGTDTAGLARWEVTPPAEGAYLVRWLAADPRGGEVVAEVRFWACERELPQIPRAAQGIQVLLERDSFAAGGEARAVLLAQQGVSHVLLTLEADKVFQAQVFDLSQGARLVPLELGSNCTPEVYLTAHAVIDGEQLLDRREVVVVPTDRLLEVTADFEAGAAGAELVLRVNDAKQEPVAARVVLSLHPDVRTSSQELEEELDPRLFFVARPRLHQVQTRSSIDARPFSRRSEEMSGVGLDDSDGASAEDKPPRAHAAPDLRSAMERARARSKVGRPGNRKEFLVERHDEEAMDFEPAGEDSPELHAASDSAPILWRADAVTNAEGILRLPLSLPPAPFQGRLTLRVCDKGQRFGFALLPVGSGQDR